MTDKFYADIITRTEVDHDASRLEISLCDTAGHSRTLSLSSEALVELVTILAQSSMAQDAAHKGLTRIPESYAVGHGRHEPLVMLRFEDEPAYGLSARQAMNLGVALVEQAEALADMKYLLRQ
jgi:hypothetical protein